MRAVLCCACALQDWGAAVRCCDDALQVKVDEASAAKAWLRRAKANLGRYEFEVCSQLRDSYCQHSLSPARAAATISFLADWCT